MDFFCTATEQFTSHEHHVETDFTRNIFHINKSPIWTWKQRQASKKPRTFLLGLWQYFDVDLMSCIGLKTRDVYQRWRWWRESQVISWEWGIWWEGGDRGGDTCSYPATAEVVLRCFPMERRLRNGGPPVPHVSLRLFIALWGGSLHNNSRCCATLLWILPTPKSNVCICCKSFHETIEIIQFLH